MFRLIHFGGVFENPINNVNSEYEKIELYVPRDIYGPDANKVGKVALIFISSDKNIIEQIKSTFQHYAVEYFGNSGEFQEKIILPNPSLTFDSYTTWTGEFSNFSSYEIQRHEDGNWIYLIIVGENK